MRKYLAASLLCASQFAAGAELGWNYEYAYTCLKALSTGISAPGTPAIFNRTGTGVFAGARNGVDGFFITTPKTAYFFPREEMTRSGDATSTQLKITVNAPESQPPQVKVYFNPTAATAAERISFGTSNEFDRVIDATDATADDTNRPAMMHAMGNALLKARPALTTNRLGLKPVVEICAKTQLDFPMDMGNGTESRFRVEIRGLQDRLAPGFFTKEYWFPKKTPTTSRN